MLVYVQAYKLLLTELTGVLATDMDLDSKGFRGFKTSCEDPMPSEENGKRLFGFYPK